MTGDRVLKKKVGDKANPKGRDKKPARQQRRAEDKEKVRQKYQAIYERGVKDGKAAMQPTIDRLREDYEHELRLRLEFQEYIPRQVYLKYFSGPAYG